MDDRGASLVMALIFILITAILGGALLAMASTSLRNTHAFRTDRIVRYNVESALNVVITMMVKDPTLGTTTRPICDQVVYLSEDDGATFDAIVGVARFEVKCAPTAGVIPGSGEVVDGVQSPRDVTMNVNCNNMRFEAGSNGGWDQLMCGGGGTATTVGRARVRFEVDTSVTDPLRRAVIPKIVSWQTA